MKAEVESGRNGSDLWVNYKEFLDINGRPLLRLSEMIIAADSGRANVWFDTYGVLTNKGSMSSTSTYGHLTAEDARIIGETLIRAADIAEGKV